MTRSGMGAIVAMGLLVTVGFSNVSRGEDLGPPPFAIDCGGNCGALATKAIPNTLFPAIPGGTFVITVAHIAPSPEDAFVRGVHAPCDSVMFRIDTLQVNKDGSVDVELGEQQELAPGQASQIVHSIGTGQNSQGPAFEQELMGFRLRSEPASSHCSIAASGLLYPDPSALTPIPVSLIPSAGASPKGFQRDER